MTTVTVRITGAVVYTTAAPVQSSHSHHLSDPYNSFDSNYLASGVVGPNSYDELVCRNAKCDLNVRYVHYVRYVSSCCCCYHLRKTDLNGDVASRPR